MGGTRIKFTDLGKFERQLGGNFPKAMKLGLQRVGKNSVARLQRRTKTAPPASDNGSVGAVAEGTFLRGWKWRAVDSTTIIVRNEAPHAVYVENGRRAGARMPPLAPLMKWMRVKGLAHAGRDARGRFATAQVADDALRGAAFILARAIARRGLRGRNILKNAQEELRRSAQDTVNRAFDQALRKSKK